MRSALLSGPPCTSVRMAFSPVRLQACILSEMGPRRGKNGAHSKNIVAYQFTVFCVVVVFFVQWGRKTETQYIILYIEDHPTPHKTAHMA